MQNIKVQAFWRCNPSIRQVARPNENGPIQFCVTGKISTPHLLLDGLAVRSENFESVFAISMKVIVQSFPGDKAPHHRFAILPVEKDHVSPENQTLHGRDM